MAEMFHVYVEGAVDPSPDAQKKLAEIMASRYGLPIADVTSRLAKGRFRVKANVDRATADVYLRDLGAVGAKVVIDVAGPRSSPSIPVPSRTATPPSGLAITNAPPGRKSSPSIPIVAPRATPPSGLSAATTPPATKSLTNPPFASGLSAAFETHASTDLGVLGGDSGSFALSSVDGGSVENAPTYASPPPPPVAPPPPPTPRQTTPKPVAVPEGGDMFAPPDADDQAQKVDLANDEIDHRTRRVEEARKRASTPPPVATAAVATPVLQRRSSTSLPPQNVGVTALSRGRLGPLSDRRNRFAAGVFVAILVGFVPTHLIASFREHDEFQRIDSKYVSDAAATTTPAAWAALDEPAFRDKKSAQHGIMLTSMLLWALFAGGAGYVWFKRVPWDKLDAT